MEGFPQAATTVSTWVETVVSGQRRSGAFAEGVELWRHRRCDL